VRKVCAEYNGGAYVPSADVWGKGRAIEREMRGEETRRERENCLTTPHHHAKETIRPSTLYLDLENEKLHKNHKEKRQNEKSPLK